jgi:hypothetical protein
MQGLRRDAALRSAGSCGVSGEGARSVGRPYDCCTACGRACRALEDGSDRGDDALLQAVAQIIRLFRLTTFRAVKHEADVESADRPSEAQFVLGVDLDGVCVDFYGKLREIAADWLERPVDELPRTSPTACPSGVSTQWASTRSSIVTRSRSAASYYEPSLH